MPRRMRPLDVGVIGCGTAGSAAAVFLARAGHTVTVYERVANPGPVGAGITIQPTGLHVLHRLGAYEYVVARGARIERLLCETPSHKTIVDLAYGTLGEGLFGVGLHRGALFESLLTLVRREPITMRAGVEIVDLARAGAGKRWMLDVNGDRHGPHDLVVVADGARSQLRDDTSTSKRIERYPWGALWFVAKDRRDQRDARTKVLHQIVRGSQTFLGFLPTGLGPSSTAGVTPSRAEGSGEPLVSLFWSLRGDAFEAWRARGLAAWKEELLSLSPECEPLVSQIEDVDQVLFAAYHDIVMHRWTTRNVVYLGDAAHATSPQLGQGCNLALWDAMTLADVLLAEPHSLQVALDRYSRERRDHLAFYQFATRWLTPFFQGDHAILGQLRDLGMPLLGKLSLTNRLMTLAMLGVIDGFTGRTLSLELPERAPSTRR
jgi:2-polyprenyl-6-methoxyphenol hydroxylase-like FAD-dependent oxidoreductase